VALFRPDDTYIKTFGITNATGAAVNADGTPAGSLLRNGAVDGTVTVAVAGVSGQAGIYAASCTIPSSYAAGDVVELLITATIGGVAVKDVVDRIRLVGFPPTALPNAAAGAPGGLITRGTGTGQLSPATGGKVAATLAAGDVATDAISAATLATDAVAEIQSGLATAATQTTILVRLGAFTGSGVTGTGGGGSTDLPAIELIGTIAASPTPTTTAITVDLDEPLDAEIAAADLAGTYCTVDGRGPKGRLVATATIGSGRTGVVLTFAAGAFAAGAAQAGDRVTITG
jgi:hypothetical protein